jgi:Tfp pilus assembly protein PilN
MSVRVNLLPEATRTKDRAGRQRLAAGAAALAVFLALGAVWWWADAQVSEAEDRLADEQQITAGLRAEEAELVAFRDLAASRERVDDVLVFALADEIAVAGVLQDLAAVLPPDVQLDTLALSLRPPSPERIDVVGTFNLTGQTVSSHAPGVERLLLSLDRVAGFRDLFLTSSVADPARDDEVVAFTVDGGLSPLTRTDRYRDGLPGGPR